MNFKSTEQVLVLLFGGLSANSFLTRQLGLSSVFDLFTNDSWYCDDPKTWFPAGPNKVTFLKVRDRFDENRISEYASGHADFHRIVFWPATKRPRDGAAWTDLMAHVLNQKNKIINLCGENSLSIECDDLDAPCETFNTLLISPQPRAFNKIRMTNGVVTKTSEKLAKLEAEIYFLKHIPKQLKEFYPAIIDDAKPPRSLDYEIPLYMMPDLSRHLLHNSMTNSAWHSAFAKLSLYFKSCPKIKAHESVVRANLKALFVDKLEQRTAETHKRAPNSRLLQTSHDLARRLTAKIETMNCDTLFHSHGDLCFSNILMDRQNFEMKLIDPRGCTSETGAYLPLEYDFAKLSQCVFGHYDLILAQNTELTTGRRKVPALETHFRALMQQWGIDEGFVRLGEASLFLSMIALHFDRPQLHWKMLAAAENAISESENISRAG